MGLVKVPNSAGVSLSLGGDCAGLVLKAGDKASWSQNLPRRASDFSPAREPAFQRAQWRIPRQLESSGGRVWRHHQQTILISRLVLFLQTLRHFATHAEQPSGIVLRRHCPGRTGGRDACRRLVVASRYRCLSRQAHAQGPRRGDHAVRNSGPIRFIELRCTGGSIRRLP